MDSGHATFGQLPKSVGDVLRGADDFRIIGAPVEFLAHLQSQPPVTPQLLANPAVWPQGAGFPLPMPPRIGSSDSDASLNETGESESGDTESAGQAPTITAGGGLDQIETQQHEAAMTALAAAPQELAFIPDRFAQMFAQAA